MTLVYDPAAYWLERGESYAAGGPAYRAQEAELARTLRGLPFASVLEVGCGTGRITRLLRSIRPDAAVTAIDISPTMLAAAADPAVELVESSLAGFPETRRWDLVIAAEVLMHVPPAEMHEATAKLLRLAARAVVTVDWTVRRRRPPMAHNFLHDYDALWRLAGARSVARRRVGLQSIYVVTP